MRDDELAEQLRKEARRTTGANAKTAMTVAADRLDVFETELEELTQTLASMVAEAARAGGDQQDLITRLRHQGGNKDCLAAADCIERQAAKVEGLLGLFALLEAAIAAQAAYDAAHVARSGEELRPASAS
jgi:hypothetical protein